MSAVVLARHGGEPWALYGLVLVLPFELPRPVVRLGGLELTILEIVAAPALVAMFASAARSRYVREILRAPLLAPGLFFLLVCVLSAAAADPPRLLPLKFSLRVAAGVTAFALSGAALARAPSLQHLLAAFTVAGALSALIGLAATAGLPGASPLLNAFHSRTFEVGGAYRLTSTFVYPNSAAGFWLFALAGALFFAARSEQRTHRLAATITAGVLLVAILLTYSRGALLGAVAVQSILWASASARRETAIAARLRRVATGFVLLVGGFSVFEPSIRMRALGSDAASWYRARIVPDARELALQPGESFETAVRVENAGTRRWGPTLFLSYRWYDCAANRLLDTQGQRTPLAAAIQPGDTARVLATGSAPTREGSFLLIWEILSREHNTPFVEKEGVEQYVSVVVGRPSEASPPPKEVIADFIEGAWRPGRLELWALAVRLFYENPVLGVGPDNFRWRYGQAAGRRLWDTRTFSNSLYLEILATTGLLGAVAFVGLLVAAGKRLAKLESAPVAATLAAGLGGFLVHGVFDYLLAFTPIYLAFWLWLGAVSGLKA